MLLKIFNTIILLAVCCAMAYSQTPEPITVTNSPPDSIGCDILVESTDALAGRKVYFRDAYNENLSFYDSTFTDNNGEYGYISNWPFTDVCPISSNDPLNGVSTYDLVLISQHILGIVYFDSPFKMIAADINHDGQITTFDVIVTQQLILYVIPEFPNCNAWRFFPNGYYNYMMGDFGNNPFSAYMHHPHHVNHPEYTYNGNPSWMDKLDLWPKDSMCIDNKDEWRFIAIKVGDVSINANTSSSSATYDYTNPSASKRKITTTVNYKGKDKLKRKKTYTINVKATSLDDILGYQLGLALDAEGVEVKNITPNSNFPSYSSTNNFHVREENGYTAIRTSWLDEDKGTAISLKDEILFSLEIEPKETISASELIYISEDILELEFVTDKVVVGPKPIISIEVLD